MRVTSSSSSSSSRKEEFLEENNEFFLERLREALADDDDDDENASSRVHTTGEFFESCKRDMGNTHGRKGGGEQNMEAVVRVKTTREVENIVRACAEFKKPVVTRGAGTGLEGGCVAYFGSQKVMRASIGPQYPVAAIGWCTCLWQHVRHATRDRVLTRRDAGLPSNLESFH